MPELGPWPPDDRPPVWVLHDGDWCRGRLFSWHPPVGPDAPWHGYARWALGLQQCEGLVPQQWLAERAGVEPPAVPDGVIGLPAPPTSGR